MKKKLMRKFNELLCKLTNHVYYVGCEESESIKCSRCKSWVKTSEAYGSWK